MMGQIQAVDPVNLRDFFIIVGFLLSAGTSMIALLSSKRTQRREVSIAEEFVSNTVWKAMNAQFEQRVVALERDIRDLRAEMKVDREAFNKSILIEVGKVHNRVNEVLGAVSELRGELNRIKKP